MVAVKQPRRSGKKRFSSDVIAAILQKIFHFPVPKQNEVLGPVLKYNEDGETIFS
jgi:hypothetical protein